MLTLLLLASILAFAFNIQSVKAPESTHDICIWEVAPSQTVVARGYLLPINVTVENEGDVNETFNVIAYYGDSPIPWDELWSMGDVNEDGYIDLIDSDLIIEHFGTNDPQYDINESGFVDLDDWYIWRQNDGIDIWTYFGLPPPIGKQKVDNLPANCSQIVTFTWNTRGVAKGNYTIGAKASLVPGETEIVDNEMVDGTVEIVHVCKLGALLPLTGALATYGEADLVAAEFAVEEVNALFENMGVDWTLSLVVEDTQTNPDVALEKVENLTAMGIELLVGPISSPEVGAIKDYCDANEILVISHASTAPDLAVPDDYIFRFIAQEGIGQGPAIGRMIYDDGKRYVIPVTRNDSWGVAIEEAVELKFEGLGGTFLGGIRYQPEEMDFSDEAYALDEIVASAVYAYGAANVSVLHISLGEVNAFMNACLAYSNLTDVKWYGSEGTCENGAMLEDPNVRDFAMSVGYPCPLFGPTHSDKSEKVRQHCISTVGREPEPYAYNVYDIVWVYALSLLEVDAYDSRAFKVVLPTVTRNYFGASGWIELDENGDRNGGDYDILQIMEVATDEYAWEVVGRYIFATDSLVWSPFTLTPVYVFEPVWNRRIFYVVTESNSTVSDYYFNPEEGPVIRFDVNGSEGTTGFCRVAIPKRLLWVEERNWTVLIDGDPVEVTVIEEDDYYTCLLFVYSHSAKTVQITGTHVIGAPSPIVSTESTAESYEPSVAVDSSGNVHVAWWDYTNYAGCGTDSDIFYKRFVPDSGWTITEVVSTESTGNSLAPSLAVDSSGNVHVAWHDATNYTGCGTDSDIFYKRFVPDSGWTITEVVSTESTSHSGYPSLDVDLDGNVHVAWYDATNYTGCETDWDIFYKDRTHSWSTTEVVSTESTKDSWSPTLDVDLDGNVHVAWYDITNYAGCESDIDIFYKNRTYSWSTTEVVSTESTSHSYNPSLAVDSSGNVHVAWHDETNYTGCGFDEDIFYKNRTYSWSTTEVVSTESTFDSCYPSLAVDLAGNVHVAWRDPTNYTGCGSDLDIFYKRYEVGSGWTFTQVVSTQSTNASQMPSLAVDLAGNVHIAWHDETDYAGCGPDLDIFYKYTNQTLWNYTTDGLVESSPVVVDGVVFVGSNDGNVYALDQHTGAKIWNFTTGSTVYSSPAVAYGKVYVAAFDHKFFCLDAATGEHIWNHTTGGWMRSSPAVVDGKVYVGSDGGGVYCLNASTKAQIWNCPIGSWTYTSSPAVAYGRVYVGSIDGKVHCIDAATGVPIWNFTTGSTVYSSPAVADGKVYVGSYDNKVYCLDAVTKELIWNYTTLGAVHSSPAVADGKIYVGSGDGRVYCLNASTRAQIWNFTTGSAVHSSPAVADGKVYVGSFDNKTYCLDASTGVSIWNYTTDGNVYSSPAVADGMVFVGSNDNTTYAFGNVIRVPEDYPTIQEAIDAAEPWATIIIAPGTYNESIIIDKPLTIIGGKGSSTDFAGGGSGIAVTILPEASGTIVANIVMTNWDQGIFIDNASECKIYSNAMDLMGDSGIVIDGDNAANNLVYSNTICSNNIAIDLAESSTGNIICANTISENTVGINMLHSSGNIIYWNSFVNNTEHVNMSNPSNNTWDNGYPCGGNYWSDYTGEDVKSGPNQDQLGSDGIGDTPYNITLNGSEQDNYPLMSPHEYWSNPALGDINKDAKVDDKDLLQLAAAYGSTPEKSNWNLNCDLNRDCKIEALDLFYLGKTYGKNEP